MPNTYKVGACLAFLLAIVLYIFWQLCKQQPALANIATFTEDPYDAIAGIQLALFAALTQRNASSVKVQHSGPTDTMRKVMSYCVLYQNAREGSTLFGFTVLNIHQILPYSLPVWASSVQSRQPQFVYKLVMRTDTCMNTSHLLVLKPFRPALPLDKLHACLRPLQKLQAWSGDS